MKRLTTIAAAAALLFAATGCESIRVSGRLEYIDESGAAAFLGYSGKEGATIGARIDRRMPSTKGFAK